MSAPMAELAGRTAFIITQREFREGVETRFDAILASFPDAPVNEERKAAIGFLTSNRVFEETLAGKQGGQRGEAA